MTSGIFVHPTTPHVRRHEPLGYNSYDSYKPWLRDEFWFRCVYCLEREKWYPNGAASFSADHVVPQSEAADRICDYANLIYACLRCNSIRRCLKLINPTEQTFGDHIRLGEDAAYIGITPEGNDVIDNLRLNKNPALQVRRRMLRIHTLFTNHFENAQIAVLYRDIFGFPDDVPDLRKLKPPGGNALPDGVGKCFFVRRELGELPDVY